MPDFHSDSMRRLYKAILTLKTEEECAAFLDDICTIKELQDLSQRLEAALMLNDGQNYQHISKQVGISTATISRVNRCLSYGAGGYRTVIDRMNGENDEH